MTRFRSFALGVALAVTAVCATAAERSPTSEAFVAAAAQSDNYEIQAGRLILTESRDQRVRGFAQQMIDHHTQTSATLAKAAAPQACRRHPRPWAAISSRCSAHCRALKGPDLDRTYMTQQVNAHVSALVTHQTYAASGDNGDLKAAAKSTVPLIQRHLEMAKQLKASLGGK
jgi:putative membrane protein